MNIPQPVFIDQRTGGFTVLRHLVGNNRIFVVADTNTATHCLPHVKDELAIQHVFVIEAGESFKTIDTCLSLCNDFLNKGITRSDYILALGGGCVTDLAGFAAGIYKRGVPFIAVPTTLLGMTDAAIGGKNGVDFEGYKNMLGMIREPERVYIWPGFLDTLAAEEVQSGYAEIIKHALIADVNFWNELPDSFPKENIHSLLNRSIRIKHAIVTGDVYEKGGRKLLNFGHTIGHAIESFYLVKGMPVLHGEAVAAGMCIESLLSVEAGLSPDDAIKVVKRLQHIFGNSIPEIPPLKELMPFLQADKKNVAGEMRFSLLAEIGEGIHDVVIQQTRIEAAIQTYLTL